MNANVKFDNQNNDETITDVSAAEANAVAGGSARPGIVPDPMQPSPETGARSSTTTPGPYAPNIE